ncbi:MAG: hypothetical protein IJQ50_00635 [Clostridia bacterium]|nr:hypothetical protein [Clostridia bacterium]
MAMRTIPIRYGKPSRPKKSKQPFIIFLMILIIAIIFISLKFTFFNNDTKNPEEVTKQTEIDKKEIKEKYEKNALNKGKENEENLKKSEEEAKKKKEEEMLNNEAEQEETEIITPQVMQEPVNQEVSAEPAIQIYEEETETPPDDNQTEYTE